MARILYLLIFILFYVNSVECGECCRAHYDLIGAYIDEKWCSDYCCFQLSKYDCCDNILLQAPASERLDMCDAWVSAHVWVPIVCSIAFLLSIVGCCVCCCKLCCARPSRSTIIMPGGQQGPVVVQTSMQQQQQSMVDSVNPI